MLSWKKYLIAIAVCVLLIIAFIWGQSLVEFEASVRESQFLLPLIRPFYETIFGAGSLDGYTWRKLAHGIEFFVLGVLSGLLAVLVAKFSKKIKFGAKSVCVALLISEALCLVVAAVDELLQTTNNRHPQIMDVGIDMIGATCGIALAVLIMLLIVCISKLAKRK